MWKPELIGENQETSVTPKKWRGALGEVRRLVIDEIKGWTSDELYDFIRLRFSGALKIIVRASDKVGSIIIKGEGATAIIASTEFLEKGPLRLVKVLTPDGVEVRIPIGIPPEEGFHVTQVGPYGMKCTCEDAVMTASRADREFVKALKALGFEELPKPLILPLFSRFVLCKHTISLLSYLIAAGIIDYRSADLRRTLTLSTLGAALRVMGAEGIPEEVLKRSLKLLLSNT